VPSPNELEILRLPFSCDLDQHQLVQFHVIASKQAGLPTLVGAGELQSD
jgi:hypothetical protein